MWRRYAWVFLLILWTGAATFGLGRWRWLKAMETRTEEDVRTKALPLGAAMARGVAPDENQYREWVDQNAHVGYVVVANFRTGYRSGLVNAAGLKNGAKPVVDFFVAHKDAQTLTRLIQKDAGFSNQYLDVFSVAILPPAHFAEQTPLGALKVAYVVPGYPFGRGYANIWQGVLWGTIVLTLLVLVAEARNFRSLETVPATAPVAEPAAGLDELETALNDEPTVVLDEQGREWHVLFDGKELEGWDVKGEGYVTEREIALQPWGASAKHGFFERPPAYQFQLRAKKLAGSDGFVIPFTCGPLDLTWVVGGWNNERSELVGYPATQSTLNVQRMTWYKLEVRVLGDRLEAWVNDQMVWSLPRAEVRSSSPDLGFQRGIGVAVWNTLAKYKDLRLLEL